MSIVRGPVSTVVSGQYSRSTANTATASDGAVRAIVTPRATVDTAAGTDLSTRTTVQTRTSAETTSVADANTSGRAILRTASDVVHGTDAANGAGGRVATASDNAPASDGSRATGHTYYLFRTATDPPNPVTDVAVRDHLRVRTPADAAPATDAAGGSSLHARAIGDSTPGFTDTAARSVMNWRTAAETAGGQDSAARPVIYLRSAADAAPAADAALAPTTRSLTRTAADTANSVAAQVGNQIDTPLSGYLLTRAVADLGYLVDVRIQRPVAGRRSLSQSLSHPVFALRAPTSLSDRAFVQTYHFHSAAEPLATSDLATRSALSKSRTGYDQVRADEAVTRAQSLVRRPSPADAVGADETLTSLVFRLSLPVLAAVGLGDSPITSSARRLFRTGSDAVNGLDAPVPPGTHVRRAVDSAPATDTANAQVVFVRLPSLPATGLGDSPLTRTGSTFSRTGTDSAAGSVQTVVAVRVFVRRAQEDLPGQTDTAVGRRVLTRVQAESAPAVEAAPLDTRTVHPRTIADTARASETIATKRSLLRSAPDSAPAVESVDRALRLSRTGLDLVLGTDLPQIQSAHARAAADSALAISDDAVRFYNPHRIASDALAAASDALDSNVGLRSRFALDFVSCDDGLYVPRNNYISRQTADDTDLLDSPSRTQRFPRFAEDAGLGADFIDTTKVQARLLSDPAPALDHLLHQVVMPRDLSEQVFGADGAVRSTPKFRTAIDDAEDVFVDNITRFHDATTRVITLVRAVSVTVGGTDSLVHQSFVTRRIFEAAPAVAVLTRQVVYARWSAEDISLPAGIYEQANVVPGNQRSAFDQVHAFETLTASVITSLSRTGHDQAAGSDAATGARRALAFAVDTAPAADDATRSAPRTRITIEALSTRESTGRYVQLLRLPVDAAPVSDVGYAARSHFAHMVDPARASDTATRSGGRFFRVQTEQAPALDTGTGVHSYSLSAHDVLAVPTDSVVRRYRADRTTLDTAPVSDLTVGDRRSIRRANDRAAALDVATRSQVIARALVALARAVDSPAGSHVSSLRLGADSAPSADALTFHRVRVRSLVEYAAANESLARALHSWRRVEDVVRTYGDWVDIAAKGVRTLSDRAPAADEVTSIPRAIRRADDRATASESVERATHRVRRAPDAAPARDLATRVFLGARALYQVLATADAAIRAAGKVRSALDLLTTFDTLVDVRVDVIVIGPPTARILTVSRGKVSAVPGYDSARLVFEFDQPVDAWSIRVGSTSAFDGTQVASWAAVEVEGFGLAAFGTSAFGSVFETVLSADGLVYDDDLRIGENDVAIYGRNERGQWSAPDRSPALSAAP